MNFQSFRIVHRWSLVITLPVEVRHKSSKSQARSIAPPSRTPTEIHEDIDIEFNAKQMKLNNRQTNGFQFFTGRAIVDEAIEPGKRGRVRFRGSFWFALCDCTLTLRPGTTVQVVGRNKTTLLV